MFVVVNMSTHVPPMPYLSEPTTPAIPPYQIIHMAHVVADLAYDVPNELVTGLNGMMFCCTATMQTTLKWQRRSQANVMMRHARDRECIRVRVLAHARVHARGP